MKRLLSTVVFLSLLPGTASAHAVLAECRIEGDKVTLLAFFDDETPAISARIKVVDANGKVVVEGESDDRGLFTFATPPPGKYRMHIDAGAGHTLELPLENVSPTRGYPWIKVGIGLSSIALFSAAFWVSRRRAGFPA